MENQLNENQTNRFKGTKTGFILILIGLLFLAFNFGIVPNELRESIISWPMILIIIGVRKLFKRQFITGSFVFLVGVFFLIPKLYPELAPGYMHIYWPVLLISTGIFIILHRSFDHQFGKSQWAHHLGQNKGFYEAQQLDSRYGFSKNSVFGSGEHIVLDPEFKGGEVNAVFGGILLDLRRTKLQAGDTYLEINAVFGGVTIYVPTDWEIETHLDAVFGGFQDKRLPGEQIDHSRKLIITGSCVFGGGEIRN